MNRLKILILGPKARYDAYAPEFLSQLPLELVFLAQYPDAMAAARANSDAQCLLVDAITPVKAELMDLLPHLKMIHSEGVAFNCIDLDAARQRGIFVCHNKGCNASSVAEHTIMLMLMILRHGITGHRAVIEGRQIQMKEAVMVSKGPELREQTVGLIGFGDIGQATARLLRAFGCQIFYYTSHRRSPEVEAEFGVSYLPLEELVQRCTMISLHCAVNDQTRHMIDAPLLEKVHPGASLVNTARGELVDNMAVRQALIDGRLGGIAMDTLYPEPTPADHPLVALPPEVADKAVYSPHLGGNTGGSFARGHRNMWNSVRLVLEGKRPNFIVNGL